MDDIDLDYDVEEQDNGDKKPKELSKLFIIIIRALGIGVIVGLGLLLLWLNYSFLGWIADINYQPSEEELLKPRDPLAWFDFEQIFDITVLEGEKRAKVVINRLILGYESNNAPLYKYLNNMSHELEFILRTTIAKQKIENLMTTRGREEIKNEILRNMNDYILGVEKPINTKTGSKVSYGDIVRILMMVDRNDPHNIMKENYAKVINLATGEEGWLPTENIIPYDELHLRVGIDANVIDDFELLNGIRKGGAHPDIKRGMIDIYLPRGITVFMLN